MTVPAGTRLGPYEITGALGAGGMGEVYRARDRKLGRDVAIKVLPDSFAADPDRRARFEREARTLAALNHPNIAQIHGFEESPALSGLVMELVEGVELAQRLARGPIPLDEAVAIARQLAEALETAHEHGIIHRDLKPANIRIRADGVVKILDFGLAKALDPPGDEVGSGGRAGAQSPTMTSPLDTPAMTQQGLILGTAAYMAPEQAKGKAVDRRADIWAFGVVLWEMLSGRPLFEADSVPETLGAIFQRPISLDALPEGVPSRVRRLLGRCLERDPRQRLRDIGEARVELERTQSDPLGPVPGPGAPSRATPRWTAAILALIAVILTAAFIAGRLSAPRAEPAGPVAESFQQVTDSQGVESAPTLSPDGKNVVYVNDRSGHFDLYLLRVGGRNPLALTPDSPYDDWQPAFSPDGESIAFRSERSGGGVFVMGSTGESVKRVTDFGFNPTWSPDGREIVVATASFAFATDRAGSRSRELWAVDVETGQRRLVARADDAVQPNWSPNGHRIVYWGLRGSSGQRDLWTVAADGSEVDHRSLEVTNDAALDWSPVWSPDGRYVYFSSNRGGSMNLWRVRIDEASGRVLGMPEPMTAPSTWTGEIAFSRDGTRLAFASLDWRSTLVRVAFDPQQGQVVGPPVPLLTSTQAVRDHHLSPDGEWVAFNQFGSREDLFVARTNGREFRRLTDDESRDRAPAWSPDGRRLAFYSDRGGGYQVWTIRPDGSGLEQLTQIEGSANFPIWARDGRTIAVGVNPGSWYQVDLGAPESPKPARRMPALDETSAMWPLAWSPDGARLAGIQIRFDGTIASVLTFDLVRATYAVVAEADDPAWKAVVWLPDSRRLLVRDRRGISLVDGKTMRRLIPIGGYWIGRSLDIARDGRWISYTETGTEGDIWLAELRQGESQ